jgi:hypothetical protein
MPILSPAFQYYTVDPFVFETHDVELLLLLECNSLC